MRSKAVGNLFAVGFVFLSMLILLYSFLHFVGMWGSTASVLAPVIVNATTKHTASVIFLHGLGDTGHGWSAGLGSLGLSHIKFICPNAPVMTVTLNSGFKMHSWFDILTLQFSSAQDSEGIKKAALQLQALIEEEVKSGISSNRIVLGGFSQGGALALYTALTMERPLAGVLALSSWLPLHWVFPESCKGNSDKPILQCHGTADATVKPEYGEMTAKVLKSMCSKHQFKKYAGLGHSSCPEEMHDVKEWLKEVLPQES